MTTDVSSAPHAREPETELSRALAEGRFEPTRIVSRRRTGVWVVGVLVTVAFISFAWAVISRPAFSWDVVRRYLFSPEILAGLAMTINLTALAVVIGLAVGLIAAIMLRSKNPVLNGVASLYVWIFRAVPGLVQLLFWYNLATLFPTIDIGIPYGPMFFNLDPNQFMTPLLAACLGLGLSEGAYMAEIIRGGLISVPAGQHEAAAALGLSPSQTLRRVVLPQAMRSIIPPIGNQFIGMLKYTSLASVISVGELLHSAQQISATTFQIIPMLTVASIWYLVATSVLSLIQRRIEMHFNRGFDGRLALRKQKTTIQTLLTGLSRAPAGPPAGNA